MSMQKLLCLILLGLGSLARAENCPDRAHWAAFAVNNREASLQVAVVVVPEACERDFVIGLVRRQAVGGDPLTVLYRQSGALARELSGFRGLSPRVSLQAFPDSAFTDAALARPRDRSPAAKFTDEGMKRAGIWVAIGGWGVFSSMFYLTADTWPFLQAASLAAALQVMSNYTPEVMWSYLRGAKTITAKLAEKILPRMLSNRAAAEETGKFLALLLFNCVTTTSFKLALDQPATDLLDTLITASFGVWSDGISESAFEKWTAADKSERRVVATKFAKYTKSVILAVISPFMFFPSTKPEAMAGLALFGALGAAAIIFDQPFAKAAEKMVQVMENSRAVNLGADSWQKLRAGFQRLASRRRTKPRCEPSLRLAPHSGEAKVPGL